MLDQIEDFLDYGILSQSCSTANFPGTEGFVLPELIYPGLWMATGLFQRVMEPSSL